MTRSLVSVHPAAGNAVELSLRSHEGEQRGRAIVHTELVGDVLLAVWLLESDEAEESAPDSAPLDEDTGVRVSGQSRRRRW